MDKWLKNGFIIGLAVMVWLNGCGSSPDRHFHAALKYLEEHQPLSAEEHFQLAVKENPKHAEAWNQLGIIAFERGDWKTAKIRFQTAADIHPYKPEYVRNLALAFARQEDYPTALQLLRKAVDLNPRDAETYIAIAKVEWLNREPDKARQAIRQAARLDPASAEARQLSEFFRSP